MFLRLVRLFCWLAVSLSGAISIAGVDFNAVPAADISSAVGLEGWAPKSGYTTQALDLNRLARVKLNCDVDTLYPTHPDESLKEYDQFIYNRYDQKKLDGRDQTCLVAQNPASPSAKSFCLSADELMSAVISDTFSDACGHLYRGYWRVTYLGSQETMGTLVSKGRTIYPDENSPFEGAVVFGETYPVSARELMFLTPVFEGDKAKIAQAVGWANRLGFFLDPQTNLFGRRKK